MAVIRVAIGAFEERKDLVVREEGHHAGDEEGDDGDEQPAAQLGEMLGERHGVG